MFLEITFLQSKYLDEPLEDAHSALRASTGFTRVILRAGK